MDSMVSLLAARQRLGQAMALRVERPTGALTTQEAVSPCHVYIARVKVRGPGICVH